MWKGFPCYPVIKGWSRDALYPRFLWNMKSFNCHYSLLQIQSYRGLFRSCWPFRLCFQKKKKKESLMDFNVLNMSRSLFVLIFIYIFIYILLQRAEMSCTSARWSLTTKKWASAPKMHRLCGRENWQPRAEQRSHKTRKKCIVPSAKVRGTKKRKKENRITSGM